VKRIIQLTFTGIFSVLFLVTNAQDYFLSGKGPFDPDIPNPEEFLGYPIGSHHTRHDQIVAYFEKLAAVSNKATFYQYGQTYELRKLINLTITSPENHAKMTAQILTGLVPEEIIHAIEAHNYQHTMKIPTSYLDKALIAADAVSGLIIAAALVMPSKKLADVQLETLIKKYKDKSFAANCNRKRIDLCEDLGLDLNSFLEISLLSLKKISNELNL